MNMDELATFVAVVRAESFTGAARTLGLQRAQVSRVISRLERKLGARLLQRSTRSVAVTELGRELYQRSTTILSAIDETQAIIQRRQAEPQGVLRLTCGVEFGQLVVNGWIRNFLKRYPAVQVDAYFTERVVDFIHEGFDLAIRVGHLADSSLFARSLGAIRYALYASPGYLKERSVPKHPQDLISHDLIMFVMAGGGATPGWHLENNGDRADVATPARLVVNNHVSARDAAADGLGVALLPCFQAVPFVEAGHLAEVLPGWTRAPVPVHAVFGSSRYLTPKVRAFIDLASQWPSEF
jgi:LysR family transcriptional regulator, regulator for bpeEF and oprC